MSRRSAAELRDEADAMSVSVPDGQVSRVLIDAVEVERGVAPRRGDGRQLGGQPEVREDLSHDGGVVDEPEYSSRPETT